MKKIGIVSCDKWVGKIKEDIMLREELLLRGYASKLISWEDQKIDFRDYDCLVLRSVWGYQNKLDEFKNWLHLLDQNNIKLINDTDVIRNNIDKHAQFKMLANNNVSIIPTIFIRNSNEFKSFLTNPFEISDLIVIKPIISGSGENTHVISSKDDYKIKNYISFDEIEKYYETIVENKGIMIQPFIGEVFEGEYSIVYIGGENTHNVLRCPDIFHHHKKKEYLTSVPESLLGLANKVSKLTEFNNCLYMRIDVILSQGRPLIMEVELAEPDLLIREIPDNLERKKVLTKFANGIERRI